MTPQPSKEPDGYVCWNPLSGYDSKVFPTKWLATQKRIQAFHDIAEIEIRPVWLSTEPLTKLKAIEEWANTKLRKFLFCSVGENYDLTTELLKELNELTSDLPAPTEE